MCSYLPCMNELSVIVSFVIFPNRINVNKNKSNDQIFLVFGEIFGFTIYKKGRRCPYPAFLRVLGFGFYCTKLSKSGCNLFRKTYSMMAPTRNATASAMTSDQTTPWKPFIQLAI